MSRAADWFRRDAWKAASKTAPLQTRAAIGRLLSRGGTVDLRDLPGHVYGHLTLGRKRCVAAASAFVGAHLA